MHFGNFRKKSVKIGKDRKFKKSVECLPENAGCIPSAVYYYIYRVDTEIAEVHADIARSFLRLLYPCYLKTNGFSGFNSLKILDP